MTNTGHSPSTWRTSSHSGNGGNCVETMVTWQKSHAAPAATTGGGMDWSKA